MINFIYYDINMNYHNFFFKKNNYYIYIYIYNRSNEKNDTVSHH